MRKLNMHEAKTNLSRVVDEIRQSGEVFLICRNGEPVAELRAYVPAKNPLATDPALKVVLNEDPTAPLDPEDWPQASD